MSREDVASFETTEGTVEDKADHADVVKLKDIHSPIYRTIRLLLKEAPAKLQKYLASLPWHQACSITKWHRMLLEYLD